MNKVELNKLMDAHYDGSADLRNAILYINAEVEALKDRVRRLETTPEPQPVDANRTCTSQILGRSCKTCAVEPCAVWEWMTTMGRWRSDYGDMSVGREIAARCKDYRP